MADVRIALFHKGAKDLLRSPEVMAALRKEAEAIKARAGDGHEIDEYVGKNRARVTVKTATVQAHIREARDHNLIQALGSSG
jgi:hypothetical protein